MCRGLVTAHLVCIFESSPRPVRIQSCEKRRASTLTSESEASLSRASYWPGEGELVSSLAGIIASQTSSQPR